MSGRHDGIKCSGQSRNARSEEELAVLLEPLEAWLPDCIRRNSNILPRIQKYDFRIQLELNIAAVVSDNGLNLKRCAEIPDSEIVGCRR